MSLDTTINQLIEERIRPFKDRIEVLELSLKVLANKINDSQVRDALAKFCSGRVVEEQTIEVPREVKQEPNQPKERAKRMPVREMLEDYFSKLDPEFKTGKRVQEICDATELNYTQVYSCLRNNPEDFEQRDGLWYPRTTPL